MTKKKLPKLPKAEARPLEERRVRSIHPGLLAKARDGNRVAIQDFCKVAADHVRVMAVLCQFEFDNVTPYLVDVLEAIGFGASPDAAYAWKKGGTPPENLAARDHYIRRQIYELMVVDKMKFGEACESYFEKCKRFWGDGNRKFDLLHLKYGICKGMKSNPNPPRPGADFFPLPPKDERVGPGWEF